MLLNRSKLILYFLLLGFFLSLPTQAFTTLPSIKHPTVVHVSLQVDDIIRISEKEETLSFQSQLRLRWRDPRLAFSEKKEGASVKIFSGQAVSNKLDTIWTPDLVLSQSRGKVVVGAQLLKIHSDGSVYFRKRLYATIGIQLALTDFPLDSQTIGFKLHSFSYISNKFSWCLISFTRFVWIRL